VVGAFHVIFDVTLTCLFEAVAAGLHSESDIVRFADAPDCVTTKVRVIPPPVTITFPVLDDVDVLAVALTTKLPLPVRLVGEMFEMVSHDWLVVGAFHVIFDVTLTCLFEAVAAGLHSESDIVKFADAAAITPTVGNIPKTKNTARNAEITRANNADFILIPSFIFFHLVVYGLRLHYCLSLWMQCRQFKNLRQNTQTPVALHN